MSQESQRINVSSEGDVTVVELADRKILDEINIMQIGEQLSQLVASADVPKIVLDFANVEHMSSSALGVLITMHKRVREKSGKLALCAIQPTIREIFEITRLNEIFAICDDRGQAVSSMES